MTQPPAKDLLHIEQLLNAGQQQEARLLLVEYIRLNPVSARAWWLMSFTITDINQQKDCLQRVLLLDPENESARDRLAKLTSEQQALKKESPRERLAKLINQSPVAPLVSSSPAPVADTTETKPGDVSSTPAWAAPTPDAVTAVEPDKTAEEKQAPPAPSAVVETSPTLPSAAKKMEPFPPPVVIDPARENAPIRKTKRKWGTTFLVIMVLMIVAVASFAIFISLQRKSQVQAQALVQAETDNFQATIVLAQTLTSLPHPTLIPTGTASPTITASPTSTFTLTSTITPTLEFTITRTPRPSRLVGPIVDLFAPDFSLADLATGQRVSLSQYEGQPVLLFFWATWCLPCKNEISTIETIYQTYKEAGLVVLAINASEDPATVSSYQSAQQLPFPILLDPGSVVQSAYEINLETLPRHFLINSSGKITYIGKGEMTLDKLKVQLDALVPRPPTVTP
jgi:peroxiredoxin